MATSKKIIFDFYHCETLTGQSNLPPISMGDVFRKLKHMFDDPEQNTVRSLKGKTLELRQLDEKPYGYRGIVGKYRKTALPHAAVPGGEERELDLDEDEHLIEKSFFKYFSDYSLLIMQRNRFAVNPNIFSIYLSIDGYTTSLNPMIEAADLRRLMNNETQVRTLTAKIARPRNPDLFRNCEHDFNNSIFATLNGSKAAVINIGLRGDGRSKDPEKRYLDPMIKRAILELKEKFHVEKAELLLEEQNGDTHPLDLVTDRLMYSKEISIPGRYPFASDMWEAIREAREEKNDELENYFGVLNGERLN